MAAIIPAIAARSIFQRVIDATPRISMSSAMLDNHNWNYEYRSSVSNEDYYGYD